MEQQIPTSAPAQEGESSNREARALPAQRRGCQEMYECLPISNGDGRSLVFCSSEPRLLSRCSHLAQAGGKHSRDALNGLSRSERKGEETAEGCVLCPWSSCCLTSSTFQRCSAVLHSPKERRQLPRRHGHDFFQAEFLRVEDFSREIEELQELLYRHSCDILPAGDVHVLRHVLCSERIGPLMPNEINLLHQLLNHTGSNALSSTERELFIRLLRKRATGDIHSEEGATLRALLLRALADSLSSEQQLNASAALQNKCGAPISPYLLDDLHFTLNGPDRQQGRNAVQAVLEEQLALYCRWPQRMAIHRLLFLEPPWPLSAEERHLLETLHQQPTVWWSPAQENRFFTSLVGRHTGGDVDCTDEAIELLLQLLAASLSPPQRQHLTLLLGASHIQALSQQPPTVSHKVHGLAPTPGQMRTMELLQRVLEGEDLTPVENGFLQAGILRELLRLLPPTDVQMLYSLVLSSDAIPVPRSGVSVLKELQRARQLWDSMGGHTACMEQIGRSGLRQMFLHYLAVSLSPQQLRVLTQLLGDNSEEQKPGKQQEGSRRSSTSSRSVACPSEIPLYGDCVGHRASEEPKASCRGEKGVCRGFEEPVRSLAEFQTGPLTALTQEQVGILERLLELHHVGCHASQQKDVCEGELLKPCQSSRTVVNYQQPPVSQFSLLQISRTLLEEQVEFIMSIVCRAQSAPRQTNADTDALTGCVCSLTTEDDMVRGACHFHSDLVTPSQRQLFHWLLDQKVNGTGAAEQEPLTRYLLSPTITRDSPSAPHVIVPCQPLIQLANSLSQTQVEMLHLFLAGCSEQPTYSYLDGAGGNTGVTEVEGVGTTDGLSESQTQHVSADCLIPAEEFCHMKKAEDTTTAHILEKDCVGTSPGVSKGLRDDDFVELIQNQLAGSQTHRKLPHGPGSEFSQSLPALNVSSTGHVHGAENGQLSVTAHINEIPGCHTLPEGSVGSKGPPEGLQINGQIDSGPPDSRLCHGQPPRPQASSPEDLANKRGMLQRLILEAADQRIFLEDLKMWRNQYKQRAKLREVLNPYILRIQALQQGYLKRCPCLYHQQQDRREEEERQANLRLLDSLESSIWGPVDQTPTQLGSLSFQGPVYSSEDLVFGSGEFGTVMNGDSTSLGAQPLAAAFRQTASTPLGRTLSKDRYSSTRQQSLASSNESFRLEQASMFTAVSGDRSSSASPVIKAPPSCISLGSAPLLGSSESQTPTSSPARLRSPMGSRAERHQGGSNRDESASREEVEVSMEERRKRMQQQALEKAQRVKEDARVAFLVLCMKQLQPGNPAFGIELVDRINLSHLNAKTLPKGKGWKTQGLLRMIEGIIMLVCKLPRGADVASVLQPLLVLASQTRAEDIDLAIHAEFEGIRRALLGIPVGASAEAEKGAVGTDKL